MNQQIPQVKFSKLKRKQALKLHAQDLMVGDFVYTYDNVISRVVSVNPHSVLVDDGKEVESMHERDLAPLPLDIALSLMGFEEISTGLASVKAYIKQSDKRDDDSCIRLDTYPGGDYYTLIGSSDIPLRNVHELQHLLRIRGFKWESDIIEFEE